VSVISIGQLAKSAQVGVDTVRFYEKQGLMPPALRRASGYREYRLEDLRRLQFIRRAKELGFSLDEIGELLALKSRPMRGVEKVKVVARRKLQQVDNKISELQRLRKVLADLVAACPGHGTPEVCPILRAFDTQEGAEP
jgi:MerR family transcriptional regulator, copper efflux regulator